MLVRYTRYARTICSLCSYDILAMLMRYTRYAREIYSLCSYDILASLVRYTRYARAIYSLCSYDMRYAHDMLACVSAKNLFNAYTVGGFLEKPLKNLSKKYVQIEISML